MERFRGVSRISIITIILSAFAVGCATTNISDDELTREQRQLRQQAKAYNKTFAQGVAWGALVGAATGALLAGSGDRAEGAAIGAAVGGAAGGIAGKYYAEKQRKAASEEAFLADLIDDARIYNQETIDLIATAETVYQDSARKLATLRESYNNGQIERQILERQIAVAKSDQSIFEDSLKVAQQNLEKHQKAHEQYANEYPNEDTGALEEEIEQIAMRVKELEQLSNSLSEDIEVSNVG